MIEDDTDSKVKDIIKQQQSKRQRRKMGNAGRNLESCNISQHIDGCEIDSRREFSL